MRLSLKVAACLAALLPTLVAATGSPAAAADPPPGTRIATGGYWTAVNAPQPVRFRDHPNWNYPNPWNDFLNGDSIYLWCYVFGAAAGPNNNRLWYLGDDWPRWTGGLINDRYLNTPGTAASPQPQGEPCKPAEQGTWERSGVVFSAVNAPGTVTFGNHPSTWWKAGFGFGTGDRMDLLCHMFGEPSGPHGNPLWYFANDLDRGTRGWINDHHLNTPGTAANPQPQTGVCYL